MQVGSCFLNYEDFKESFNSYKEETKSSYNIRSSVSVRYHNRKHGASVRHDITFTQVKFCCSQPQGHNRKRKSQESSCPAFFVLQYDEELDRLVVNEENSNHVHIEVKKECLSPVSPPATAKSLATPFKKLCSERLSPALSDEDATPESPLPEPTSPTQSIVHSKVENTISETPCYTVPSSEKSGVSELPQEEVSAAAVMRLAEVINNFLLADVGSLATMTVGDQQELERLGFQTSKMRSLFVKFPESLLLHRMPSKHNYILYAFLVETKERVGKVVHFSFLKEDSADSVSKMLNIFQGFNPDWSKIRVVFTDLSCAHREVLKEAFPSAKVLLSVYHTARLIESKARVKSSAKGKSSEERLRCALHDAVFCTSPETLSQLADRVKSTVDKELYDYLSTHWFTCELLWYMHVKKGLCFCSTYIDSLELVTNKISGLFGKQSSMESNIQQFVEYSDCFNSKGLENLRDCSLSLSAKNKSNKKRTPITLGSLPIYRPIAPAPVSAPVPAPAPAPVVKSFTNPKMNVAIVASIRKHCTELGRQLCLIEWEVVQKSTQIINTQKSFIAVQLLEESHVVTANGRSCTCHFSSRYQLPCRHILSMLLSRGKPVVETIVCVNWQRKYKLHKPLSEGEFEDTVKRFTGSEDEAKERSNKIKSLTKELSNLLLQCEGYELEVRCATLQMIVDIWSKASGAGEGQCPAPEDIKELPYQWVKKEPLEEEENMGSCELYRVDPHRTLS